MDELHYTDLPPGTESFHKKLCAAGATAGMTQADHLENRKQEVKRLQGVERALLAENERLKAQLIAALLEASDLKLRILDLEDYCS